uniref:ABC transporter I family member 6ic n=1 Tax=Rhizophora mucronata TaxID=61149 RepID=A0A2P2KFP1_RHIMU
MKQQSNVRHQFRVLYEHLVLHWAISLFPCDSRFWVQT